NQNTFQNIATGIDEIIQEIGIEKVVAIVTDNTPCMKAAWTILQNNYLQKIFLNCWAHKVNLWLKDLLGLKWSN
ncbi:1439_t:CDS:1, partial [Racocetra persica]